jgi:hypothetical protein
VPIVLEQMLLFFPHGDNAKEFIYKTSRHASYEGHQAATIINAKILEMDTQINRDRDFADVF